ncbi:MAG: hypothetical protein WCB14_03830 [Candidatus Acidiferrales bacterium]
MSNATPTTAQSHAAASAPASRPSDDEILGLVTTASTAANSKAPSTTDFDSSESDQASNAQPNSPAADPAQFRAIFESNPELRDAWRDAQSFREIFPDVESARAIQKLFPTIEDARAANSQVADLVRLDTLFFSNRPESHAELAAAIYRLNPAAFRNLAQMMNAIVSPSGDGVKPLPPLGPTSSATVQPSGGRATGTIAPNANGESNSLSQSIDGRSLGGSEDSPLQQPITAAHEHAFFHETNAAAVEGVLNSIQSQLDRLLPEATPQNTRQRLTGEIYREVDAALQSNRAFGQQLLQAFRSGQLTPENQRAIVGMVVGRAKQALPGIAKRVLGEWTSGVVAHAGARQERQRNAARRVDIAGGAPGGDSPRALMPKDIDYRRMSDNDILNL